MKNKTVIIGLLIFVIIILLPPLIHGYAYPNGGDDAAYHLNYFDSLETDNPQDMLYLSRYLVGWTLVGISNLFNISIDYLYVWFSYILLASIGLCVFWIITKLTNWKAGLISLPIVLFSSHSILYMFDSGTIYGLMTFGIFYPIGVLLLKRYFDTKSKKYLAIIPLYIVFVFMMHSVSFFMAKDVYIDPVTNYIIPSFVEDISFSYVLNRFFGLGAIIIILVSSIIIVNKKQEFNKVDKVFIAGNLMMFVILGVLSFSQITSYSTRFSMILGSVIAMFSAYLFGKVIMNNKALMYSIICVILFTSYPLARAYIVDNNSALKSLDMEVIEYVNELPGEYYSCSHEVSYWIYNRFIDKEYKAGEYPYIDRNIPMSYKSNPESPYYWMQDNVELNYIGGKVFRDGQLEIVVASE